MKKCLFFCILFVTCLFVYGCSVNNEEVKKDVNEAKKHEAEIILSKSEKKVKEYKKEIDEKTERMGKLSVDFENKMSNKQPERGKYTIKNDSEVDKKIISMIEEIKRMDKDVMKELFFIKDKIQKDEELTSEQKVILLGYVDQHSMYFLYISEYVDLVNSYLKNIINESQLFTEEENLIKELLDYRGYIIDFDVEIKRKILHENVTHPYRDSEE